MSVFALASRFPRCRTSSLVIPLHGIQWWFRVHIPLRLLWRRVIARLQWCAHPRREWSMRHDVSFMSLAILTAGTSARMVNAGITGISESFEELFGWRAGAFGFRLFV